MLSDNILQFASTLKILYVEDHKETREAMIQILEDIFGVVCVGVDGEDGLEKFQKETFSLIISDINMPKLNGIEMLKRIRHINKKIPILILSANSETNYFVETIRLGIEGYLLKPIEIDQFDFMIEKTLEKIILEKERQYYEEELIHSNRQLELIAKAKDEFLANMSHEIRTPMNAIIGLSYILLQGDLKPKQEDYINKIHTSGNLLLGIINDILDFSKIEAGKLDIENIDFSLSSVLNNVSNIIGSKAKEKNLELIFDIEQNLPSTFRGDPIRLGQIIINLMSNAIKFTNEGEVNLRIRTQELSAIKEIIKFEVIDTGIGIKDEDLRRLFDSFAQADSSVNRQYGGTGLGLSISKQLVELMGGDIEVESEYGSGSHFSFSVEFEAIGNREIENFELPSSILSNKKVLIINQNSSTSSALSKILSSFSYDCVLASTIEEAEALIEANKFASIYIEREMLLHCSAEKIPYYKQIKIIILESVFEFENDEYYNGLVPDARLEKPFTKEMVYRAILGSYSDKNLAKSETESIIDDSSGHIATRSILLAEDNKINQAVILGLLENSGIDLIIANNGKEAVDILRKNNQISLVLMDINMPVMNGYEATKIIREDLGYTTLPIIAITAGAMQKDILNAKEAGMQAHLAKPIDVHEFQALLLKYLGLKRDKDILIEKEDFPVKIAPEAKPCVLNIIDGLERVGSNEDLYKSILYDFKVKYKDIGAGFSRAYKEKNYKQGSVLAHDLKGVAGTIGASNLQHKALEFENAFRDEVPSAQLLYELIYTYQTLIEEIDEYIKA